MRSVLIGLSSNMLVSSLLVFTTLVGCGKKTGIKAVGPSGGTPQRTTPTTTSSHPAPAPSQTTNPVERINLEGTWNLTCEAREDYSFRSTIVFQGNNVTYYEEYFSDVDCGEYDDFYSDSGTFTLGTQANAQGAYTIDMNLSQYGAYYSLVRLDGQNTLYMGDRITGNGSTSATRPTQLDGIAYSR